MTMAALSSANIEYTAEELAKVSGISAETMANWGLTQSTDSLTMSQLAELASSDAQAKKVLEKIIAQNAQKVANGEITASNVGLAASEGTVTLATGSFTTAIKANIAALKTWMTSTPLGWITMIAGGILLAVKVFDWATDSVEELQEAMENSVGAYEAAKTELSSITSELESNEKAMSELLAKDKLTFAEKGQLEELKEINAELRIQKDLQEKNVDKEKKESAIDASRRYKKQFGDYEISSKKIDEYEQNADIMGNNAILISDENDISSMLAGYRQFIELREQAFKDGDQYNIDHFTELTGDIKENLFETAQELQTQKDAMSDYYNALKDIPYNNLTSEQKEVVDSYNETSEAILLIYKELDRATWNELQFSKVTQEFRDTTQELQKLGKEGKVTAEMLNDSKYDAFIQKLIDIEFISDDTEGSLRFVASAFNGTMQSAEKYLESLDAKDEITAFVDNIEEEAKALGTTSRELSELTSRHIILNNTKLSLEDKIAQIERLGIMAGWSKGKITEVIELMNRASGNVPKSLVLTDGDRSGSAQLALYNMFGGWTKVDTDVDVDTPPGGGTTKGDKGSSSDKNEALDNYLKDAENRYKIHQDETKYIDDLNYALNNLVKTEDERLDVTGKINEAYRDLADNRIKDLEHQIEMTKELKGENADVTDQLRGIQRISHEEAERLRAMGYDDNSNEIQELQKSWWDAQKEIVDRNLSHSEDWINDRNTYNDWDKFGDNEIAAWKRVLTRFEKEFPYEVEKIKEIRENLFNAEKEAYEKSLEDIDAYIDARNFYSDWDNYGDNEIKALGREIEKVTDAYRRELISLEEYNKTVLELEQRIYEVAKDTVLDDLDLSQSKLSSLQTLTQAHFDATNSIAEAQHEINKELEASKTMYEWLDKDTRKLLFNQEDYNVLAEELGDIQKQANKLQREYNNKILNATEETLEEITSQYEMQYETLMKSYEIAKAELEVAKKRQQLDNVLNERNVRMFINGQWQWVANTQDVINAQNELADAEYAKQQANTSLEQTESMHQLQKAQDKLTTTINNIENGLVNFDEEIGDITGGLSVISSVDVPALRSIMRESCTAIKDFAETLTSETIETPMSYSNSVDYAALMADVPKGSAAWNYLNKHRNAKIVGENLHYKPFASGSRYTPGGNMLVGEDKKNPFELFIDSRGYTIPVNHPTLFANTNPGGIVFNNDQMADARKLWELTKFGKINSSGLVNKAVPQNTDNRVDNSQHVYIQNLEVDSSVFDIDALRRFTATH